MSYRTYQYSMLGSHGAMAIVHGSLPYEHAAVRVQRYPRELMSFLAVRYPVPGYRELMSSTRVPPGYSDMDSGFLLLCTILHYPGACL